MKRENKMKSTVNDLDIRVLRNCLLSNSYKLGLTSLDDIGLLAYYLYEYKAIDKVGLKLSIIRNINLHIQDDILS